MPRKAKENVNLEDIKKSTTTKAKQPTAKKSTSKKATSTSSIKKRTSTLSNNTKKESKAIKSSSASKKNAKKETTTKSKKVTSSTKKKSQSPITEYYDLPQNYNQTAVKILAQTPKTLFVYWELSSVDIENYKKQYGDNFFEVTRPVLIIYNDTLNYSFEVKINDFANSWYLHVNDSKSNYRIELGRRPIQKNKNIKSDYFYISSSNKIESPNDRILFNTSQNSIHFRNIKNNQEFEKDISTLSFMKNIRKIYNIYDLYKELYQNDDYLEDLSNPSSHTSSQFK